MSRSSGRRGGDFFSRAGSARGSVTSHFTARRRRSGVQSKPRCFRTCYIIPGRWGRMRRTVGSHWFAEAWIRSPYAAFCVAVSLANISGRLSRIPGLPGSRPFALTALMPALVRSEINARSSCATAPSTWSENIPCGVAVSIGSRSERKCAFLAVRSSITSSRWLTDRASRSSRTTTSVSPSPISRSNLARGARARDAPEPCS